MTKAIFNFNNWDIMFDCENHAGDHDVCTIVSTLCNVLVAAARKAGIEPTKYDKGHVRIDIHNAGYPTAEVFRLVEELMHSVADQYPEHVRIY